LVNLAIQILQINHKTTYERLRTDKVDHVKVEKLIKKIEIYLSTKEKRKEMAEQIINIELLLTMVGDTLRESQRKSKENFAELYLYQVVLLILMVKKIKPINKTTLQQT
jgi:hypothetical protein